MGTDDPSDISEGMRRMLEEFEDSWLGEDPTDGIEFCNNLQTKLDELRAAIQERMIK